MIIQHQVQFKASPEQVWDLLTKPAMTAKYMYGAGAQSTWEVGAPLLWIGKTEAGEDVVFVSGTVLEIEKGHKLVYSLFPAGSEMEDIPANHIRMSYELEAAGAGTILNMVQDQFEDAANGQQRYEESKQGWDIIIPLMKQALGE